MVIYIVACAHSSICAGMSSPFWLYSDRQYVRGPAAGREGCMPGRARIGRDGRVARAEEVLGVELIKEERTDEDHLEQRLERHRRASEACRQRPRHGVPRPAEFCALRTAGAEEFPGVSDGMVDAEHEKHHAWHEVACCRARRHVRHRELARHDDDEFAHTQVHTPEFRPSPRPVPRRGGEPPEGPPG